jgi:anti-anti-sigma factor
LRANSLPSSKRLFIESKGTHLVPSHPPPILTLPERVDTWTIQKVEEAFFSQHLEPGDYAILDFGQTAFVSSSGIRFLLIASDRLRKNGGGDVLLAGMQPSVLSVLEICNLDKRFQIFDSVHAAQQFCGHA